MTESNEPISIRSGMLGPGIRKSGLIVMGELMKMRPYCRVAASLLIALLVPFSNAHAQLGDMLKQGDSGGGLRNFSDPGGMLPGGSTLMPSSTGNVAGLLQFCIRNNYLGGNGVASVKDSLMSKLGGNPSSNRGYRSGASGIIDGGNGQTLDLSGGGLKQQMTQQVCDKVLSRGKSLL